MAEPALTPSAEGPLRQAARAAPIALVPEVGEPASAPARPAPRIELPSYDLGAALDLERELGISHVLAQVLVRRGHSDPDDVRELLEPTTLHDPGEFTGIDDAVRLIRTHVAAGNRITIHGDYDVDGICATAIMVRGLRALGADANWFLPSRSDDGYGLSRETVARLTARGTRLLITVDCAITAVEEVDCARDAGLEVIVTDHHAPCRDGELPRCPIVHPGVCGYPSEDLCGTGVAFKLAQALGVPGVDDDLELVALATVADLVPLRGENRRMVRDGLERMACTGRAGLRALMQVSGTDPSALDARALGFRLAPRLNAAGRLRRADAGLELLLTDDRERAREIAEELDLVNGERRAIEQRIGWEADAQVAELGDRSIYVLAAEGWHAGVIGIVASRVVERYHRPAVLIALDGDGSAQGSGRSIPGFDLLAALHSASAEMTRYGGHPAAAGLTVMRDRVPALEEALRRHADEVLTPDLLEPVERVDAVASGCQLGLRLADELMAIEPCGMANPPVTLVVPGARFGAVRAIGDGRHARFSVSSGGTSASAVSFGCDGVVPGGDGIPLDATFRLERNVWRGAVEPRLILRHAKECAPPPIALIGDDGSYLDGVLDEFDAPIDVTHARPAGQTAAARVRTVLDRRGESPLSVLADALSAGGEVLAICADVPRRLGGLSARSGGFSLITHAALARRRTVADHFAHIVVLDPPTSAAADELMRLGAGYTHLSWGEAELRFAEQMHELEYGLRTSLVALYRSIRLRRRVAGEELEHLLRGDGAHALPPRLAGRMLRVLAELELVSLDRDLPALAAADVEQRTEL